MLELDKYIENFKIDCNEFIDVDLKMSDDKSKLSYLYAYYHYFNADQSCFEDITRGYCSSNMDYIDAVYIDEESDEPELDFLSVNILNNDFSIEDAIEKMMSIQDVIFYKNVTDLRQELKDIIKGYDFERLDSKIKIKYVTNYNPKTSREKNKIISKIEKLDIDKKIKFEIVFGYDIEYEVLEIENPKEYVDNGEVKIDIANNYMYYGDEKSLVVNVSAKSIKELYESYGYRGLFSQNLRYYVKNSKIDDNIINSIMNNSDRFWYLNNGIIFVCDDYTIKDQYIKLNKFSIINGGQTTKLIGITDFDRDFYIQCKIIKNKYDNEDEKIDFISEVAEASNTQKPIKEKDLIANRIEQRQLKKQLAEIGVYCQIKRGEKVNKKLYPNPWQNTTNEELGQFLLSFVYQMPGPARNNKATICNNKDRYALLFCKKYNSEFLSDLLLIKSYYKMWVNDVKKYEISDHYKLGLVKNGLMFMFGMIGIVCKIYYNPSLINKLDEYSNNDQKMELLSQHDIDHHFIKLNATKEDLFNLFNYCYKKFYLPSFEMIKSFKPNYIYSNFTKLNSNYITYVIKQILFEYQFGVPQNDLDTLRKILYKPSESELIRNKNLLIQYANPISSEYGIEYEGPNIRSYEIKKALIDYRTKTFKKKRIKAYEIFKNIACERIAKSAPTSISELEELRCLDKKQIDLYGEDIINIVIACLSKDESLL